MSFLDPYEKNRPISLLTGLTVAPELAMTGEITLRGKVLPVGGIKEKVIAAKSAGIRRVILPNKNEKDLEDVSEPVRNALEFQFVGEIEEVLDLAFGDALKNREWTPPGDLETDADETVTVVTAGDDVADSDDAIRAGVDD